ncbi:MAG: 2-phospho-L-lactate transferase [Gammaproteobacteria bacterium]|nr:2-phospho-L-lactate transferase [Gammaproteobacteria bacterium]
MSIVALTGGVGGAKLALGLQRVLAPDALVLVVNTGDDFVHLGLHVSPDIDTVVYTLTGLVNVETGWGRADETWTFMQALAGLGGETWFRLGDGDLAMHVERTRRLAAGESLSAVTAHLARRLGLGVKILPMSDDPVRTRIVTADGELDFQNYFVERRCVPVVTALGYAGADTARPAPGVLEALRAPGLEAVVICPSNPWLSIDPILAVPALRVALHDCAAPVIAVSPLVGGQAVKGPTAKIMAELGMPVYAAAVARHYEGLLDGFVLDERDAGDAAQIGVPVCIADTLMRDLADRERLARTTLEFAGTLAGGRGAP